MSPRGLASFAFEGLGPALGLLGGDLGLAGGGERGQGFLEGRPRRGAGALARIADCKAWLAPGARQESSAQSRSLSTARREAVAPGSVAISKAAASRSTSGQRETSPP